MHVQLMKIFIPSLWLFTVKTWCINIIIVLVLFQSNTMKKEMLFIRNYSTIYHILSKAVFMSTFFMVVFMYNENVLICKWEIITLIPNFVILSYCYQYNQYLIHFTCDDIIFTFEAFTNHKIDAFYITERKRT